MSSLIEPGHIEEAFLKVITDDIRHGLRYRVMAVIQPQIDEVIEAAVKELRARVAAQKDILMDRMVIHLVVNRP